MAVSKSIRFEVFARDGFTCQYCGTQPPNVVLEVDHIHPVSKGGDDDPINLITSCFDCNRGKRAKVISEVAPRPDADIALLKVHQEISEVKRYLAAKKKLDTAQKKVFDALRDTWAQYLTETVPSDRVLSPWVKFYGPEEIEVAIKAATRLYMSKKYWTEEKAFNSLIPYVGGVLRNRKNEVTPWDA